jgi:hypothetical protein
MSQLKTHYTLYPDTHTHTLKLRAKEGKDNVH